MVDQHRPAAAKPTIPQCGRNTRTTWCALYGFLLVSVAVSAYGFGVALGPLRWLLLNPPLLRQINEAIVWYSGIPLVAGALLICWDLFGYVRRLRSLKSIRQDPPKNLWLTVVLTAYNDERSIGGAVKDFCAHPQVARVIVISNNSTDRTMEFAAQAGAIVFNETRQGYGACVHRALREALSHDDTELTLLCEGDLTFRAADIEKFLAYIPHADVVNGSRIVEQLQERDTQLSLFMHYGNLFAGKVLELKHLGMVSLTDVGTTYKLCRNTPLRDLMTRLDPEVNLEFNAYFLDTALKAGLRILECPITFYPRVGVLAGGIALAAANVFQSVSYQSKWRDGETLWQYHIALPNPSTIAYENLAANYYANFTTAHTQQNTPQMISSIRKMEIVLQEGMNKFWPDRQQSPPPETYYLFFLQSLVQQVGGEDDAALQSLLTSDRLHPNFDATNLNLARLYRELAENAKTPEQKKSDIAAARERFQKYIALEYRGRPAPPEMQKEFDDIKADVK